MSTSAIMDTSRRVKRRIWSEALKREIVAAAAAPGASVSIVARRYDVNTNLVFTWRKLYGADAPPALIPSLCNQNLCAQSRRPSVMMCQGSSLFQAAQQWSTMLS